MTSQPKPGALRASAVNWAFATGLLLCLIYWYLQHPEGFFSTGYVEDTCIIETARQSLAETLARGLPLSFSSTSYLHPNGITLGFLPWTMEYSWLGAYIRNWNRDFPWLWVYFGISLLGSYVGVGYLLRRMNLGKTTAWALASLVVIFNLPRIYKTYNHPDYVTQHWVYWTLFLDAWIWQRFWREKRWSWSLETWRVFLMAGSIADWK
jgi:hypothetical protein